MEEGPETDETGGKTENLSASKQVGHPKLNPSRILQGRVCRRVPSREY